MYIHQCHVHIFPILIHNYTDFVGSHCVDHTDMHTEGVYVATFIHMYFYVLYLIHMLYSTVQVQGNECSHYAFKHILMTMYFALLQEGLSTVPLH